MKDEIKEILEELENMYEISELEEQVNNINKIRDYITNLQQLEQEHKKINGELREENSKLKIALQNIQEDYDRRTKENERLKEQLKKDNHILGCNFASKDKYKQRYDDYKSRCKKAIEYIKQNCEIRRYDDYDEIGKVEGIPLLNILQGENNE